MVQEKRGDCKECPQVVMLKSDNKIFRWAVGTGVSLLIFITSFGVYDQRCLRDSITKLTEKYDRQYLELRLTTSDLRKDVDWLFSSK